MLPHPDAIRSHLDVILASRPFASATRARRFLTYIVEETLAGRSEGIKELVLGVEVFDRPADFDPKLDTIVRVEAGKLRKRLDDFYANEGAGAPVRIEVPKGSYVPQFHFSSNTAGPSEPPPLPARRPYPAIAAAVLLVALGSWWAVARLRAPAPAPPPSIAVLPFVNFSTDPANEYFADGLSEELTDALCNAGGLRVASRTSAFTFKGQSVAIPEIAAKLRVAYVVEGSVRKQGDQLKITAQLIRAEDGYHVWSGSFERKLSDVFAVQRELASSVVDALQLKLTGSQTRRLTRAHTTNQQAFDLYLRGRHVFSSFAPDAVDRAVKLFQQSIDADPSYAPPYLGLADAYGLADIIGSAPAVELFAKSAAAVNKALELDSEMADAHVALSVISARHHHDWVAAERQLRRALELNPNSAKAHYNLAQNILAPQERWEEALAENRLAAELDPLSPMITMGEPWLAVLQGRSDAAVEGFSRLVAAGPQDIMARGGLGFALLGKRDYAAALDTLSQLQAVAPSPQNLALIAMAQARSGNSDAARRNLRQLEEQSRKTYVAAGALALVYAGLGDRDNTFRCLEQAARDQESSLIFLRTAGFWDPFRNDPRFTAVLRSVGLADEQLPRYQQRTSKSNP